jgi:hypothetical protein
MPDHHFADVISAGKICIAALAGVSEAHIIGKPFIGSELVKKVARALRGKLIPSRAAQPVAVEMTIEIAIPSHIKGLDLTRRGKLLVIRVDHWPPLTRARASARR